MKKMEERLKESIQPRTPARNLARTPAKAKPDLEIPSPPAKPEREDTLNAPITPLHPQRIWPD